MIGVSVSRFEWIALAVLAVCVWIYPRLGDRLFRRCEEAFGRLAQRKHLAIVIAGLTPILLRLALLPVLPVPAATIHDEFSYLLAADTFAHGRLTNPPHPMWLSFETFHVNMLPTYASKYPPAQGMVLALGQLLGHPWLGVLLSVGAMCAAICWMLQAWLPPGWAFLGSLLAAIRFGSFSYWINSYWGGAVAGIGGALALGALPLIRRTPRKRYAVILGIGVAILANSRPFEGLIFTIPIFIWLLHWLLQKDGPPLRTKLRHSVIPLAVVLALAGGWIGYYNWRVTRNPALFPYVLNQRTYETEPLFLWQSARPKHAYNNAQLDLFYNTWTRSQYHRSWPDIQAVTLSKFKNFWGTFLGPVCVLPAFMLPWVLRDLRSRFFVITFAVSCLGLLSVVWSLGHYAAPLTGLAFGLIVQSMRHLRQLRFEARPVGLAWLRISVLMLFVAFGASLVRQVQHPYSWIFGFGPGNLQRASILKDLQSQPGKQLVMVRYAPGHHYVHDEWVYNDADIDSAKVVWARELNNEQDEKLISYFKDRHLWLLEPDNAPIDLKPYAPPTLITRKSSQ
jgi:hypothetical protein